MRAMGGVCGLALSCGGFLVGCGGEPLPSERMETLIPEVSTTFVRGTAVPLVVGTFTRVFQPRNGRYLNDHGFARGDDGRLHVYGITHTSPGHPQEERSFLHASATSPWGPWTEDERDVLVAEGDEQVLWAPYVFRSTLSQWTMLFWGGTTETGAPTQGLRIAESTDLTNWQRNGRRAPGGRDPFVMQVDGRWMLYSTGANAQAHGQIVMSESTDLMAWSEPRVVIEDPVPSYGWGNLESPFVVRYAGAWYMFLTRTGYGHTDYTRTIVFRSNDPARFAWLPLTELRAHAAEILQDNDQWFVTSAGWTSEVGPENRGLSVARLQWITVE